MDLEVVTLTLGHQTVILSLKDVVSSLVQWVETSVWELMLVRHTELMVGAVCAGGALFCGFSSETERRTETTQH